MKLEKRLRNSIKTLLEHAVMVDSPNTAFSWGRALLAAFSKEDSPEIKAMMLTRLEELYVYFDELVHDSESGVSVAPRVFTMLAKMRQLIIEKYSKEETLTNTSLLTPEQLEALLKINAPLGGPQQEAGCRRREC